MIRLATHRAASSRSSLKLSIRSALYSVAAKVRKLQIRESIQKMQESTATLAGVNVRISKPPNEPSGVTFLLPGAMIAISEYNSIRNVLVKIKNQVVLSFFTNVLTTNHRVMASWVPAIFNAYQRQQQDEKFETYSIVGHSVGAKIALIVATLSDIEHVSTVVSLDPIDMNPCEFTSGTLKLADATSSVYITWASAGGIGITNYNNPRAVYETNPSAVARFVEFKDAGHIAYTDNGGGLPGLLMRRGTKEGNKRAHVDTLELVGWLIK